MGLPNELQDVAYDSLPILLLTIVAAAFRHLRAAISASLRPFVSELDESLLDLVGSGLANLISLAEQLNLNRACSSELRDEADCSDCVVCLYKLRRGERVRRLECRHVFHKKCLDAWLKQLHFTCPLCRSPVPAPPPHAAAKASNLEIRFGSESVAWFGFR
uniref:RING-type domain-containing protein n=1 Tax=Kalanchoe fedtschenkoi TaxID=63787 RepID=A0A7N0VAU0_KALFE